jgi:hypothetical protein
MRSAESTRSQYVVHVGVSGHCALLNPAHPPTHVDATQAVIVQVVTIQTSSVGATAEVMASAKSVWVPSVALLLECYWLQRKIDDYVVALNRGVLPRNTPQQRPLDWYTRQVHLAITQEGAPEVAATWKERFSPDAVTSAGLQAGSSPAERGDDSSSEEDTSDHEDTMQDEGSEEAGEEEDEEGEDEEGEDEEGSEESDCDEGVVEVCLDMLVSHGGDRDAAMTAMFSTNALYVPGRRENRAQEKALDEACARFEAGRNSSS